MKTGRHKHLCGTNLEILKKIMKKKIDPLNKNLKNKNLK